METGLEDMEENLTCGDAGRKVCDDIEVRFEDFAV